MFDSINYGSYSQNANFNALSIEYELKLFIKRPIDHLTDNIVERLRVSSIELSFDQWMYDSNSWIFDFVELTFDGDQRLIAGWQIYRENGDIVFRLKNGSVIDIYTNQK